MGDTKSDNIEYKQMGNRERGDTVTEKMGNTSKRVGDSPSHHLLSFSFQFNPQYLFCG